MALSVGECLVQGFAVVDDGVDADEFQGAHHRVGRLGQAEPAAGLAERTVGDEEDVDSAGSMKVTWRAPGQRYGAAAPCAKGRAGPRRSRLAPALPMRAEKRTAPAGIGWTQHFP